MAFFNLDVILRSATSLLPVFFFLVSLIFIDSYKLVKFRVVVRSIAAGAIAAAVCFFINTWILSAVDIGAQTFSRYLAPFIEELFKAFFLIYLVRSYKVGFLVDAAIHGFAVGAGFAFIENIYYVQSLTNAPLLTWIVRGFGTAIMHGGTMTIFAIITKSLYDRAPEHRLRIFLPGLGAAYVLHSLFNHFLLPPLASTALLIAVFPLLIILIFSHSEKATRDWLGTGFDTDQELLELLTSGELSGSRVGLYLHALKAKFPGEVIVDMLCLLRLHVELAIQAKGLLMMKEAGFRVTTPPDVKAKFEELKYLEKSIGTTGQLAIAPFVHTSSRDLWQLHMLNQ